MRMQRPVVVLPHPDSPNEAQGSPRRMEKKTPSKALTTAEWAPQESAAHLKVLHEVADLEDHLAGPRSGTVSVRDCVPPCSCGRLCIRRRPLAKFTRHSPARRPVSTIDGLEGGISAVATRNGVGAARLERTSARQAREVGRLTLDGASFARLGSSSRGTDRNRPSVYG